MQTEVIGADQESAVTRAVELLRAGRVVALPTETVYGLAADALNPQAAAQIFAVKERPKFDPLIVHLPDRDWLDRIAQIPLEDRSLVDRLTQRFWPGPFTLILPRKAIVPDIVTAGLETVAVRMSSHPVFAKIVRAFGRPLAAPSANRFGRISPTTAAHVLDELGGRIPLIIDGGPTRIGIESTILQVKTGGLAILRKGPVTAEELSEIAELKENADIMIIAPGQLQSHYAPRTPLQVVASAEMTKVAPDMRVGLLAWGAPANPSRFVEVRVLSPSADLIEAATNLFRFLRELDAAQLDLIVAEEIPTHGLGAAIMDRLHRAAAKT